MMLLKIINTLFPLKPNPSTLGIKYPSFRDEPLRTSTIWLSGKRLDDGAEGLWRVHDNLYDLNNFIKSHPGGSQWLELTQGTDITEAFESHHLTLKAENLLPKFFIRKATKPRNFPFTFNDDGFYKTLKRNVMNAYPHVPKWPITKSKLIIDFLLFLYIALSVISVYFWNFGLGALTGIFLYLTTIASHNFFHQKDNFRMYYFDFSLMSSRSWRVSHVMSHHMYTNTISDLEISQLEPFLQHLTSKKSIFVRYMSWLYSPIVYSCIFFGAWIRDTTEIVCKKQKFTKARLLPFTTPLFILILTGISPLRIIIMHVWILLTGSFYFGVVGVNAAHHHPDIFHDGDAPRPKDELDWGVYQMDAVMDRKEITGSHFLVLTHFGDHALHHLFPTLDHGVLEYLYPVFKQTCKEFGIEFRMTSQLDLILGQFMQLAKAKPKPNPPKPLSRPNKTVL